MTPEGYFRVRADILVPASLPRWVARRFGVSEAKARRIVERAVRLHAQLWTSIAEVLEPNEGETERTLIFSSMFRWTAREGDQWFECGNGRGGRARKMVDGKSCDDEENAR